MCISFVFMYTIWCVLFFIAYMFVGFGSRNAQDSRWWGTTSGCLIFSCDGHMRQVGQPSLNFQVRFVATNLVLRWSKAWLESWTNPCYHHGLCRFGVYLVQRLARPPPQWVKPSIIFLQLTGVELLIHELTWDEIGLSRPVGPTLRWSRNNWHITWWWLDLYLHLGFLVISEW